MSDIADMLINADSIVRYFRRNMKKDNLRKANEIYEFLSHIDGYELSLREYGEGVPRRFESVATVREMGVLWTRLYNLKNRLKSLTWQRVVGQEEVQVLYWEVEEIHKLVDRPTTERAATSLEMASGWDSTTDGGKATPAGSHAAPAMVTEWSERVDSNVASNLDRADWFTRDMIESELPKLRKGSS